MRHYCTYFDANYMLRGLTLFRSMQQHEAEFVLWVLCCDELSFENLKKLDLANLIPVRLSEVESFEPRLSQAKANRNPVEYLWTLSPVWPLYLLQRDPSIEMVTYLDADLFFYSSPDAIFEEMGESSIAIFSHRFHERNHHMADHGIYNVGWLSFRRDAEAIACLEGWRDQCLEWCYDRCEPGRHGDQKYLDEWPTKFAGLRVIEHVGAGVAPWNWERYEFGQRDGQIYSDDRPLIFFHFHGLRFLNSWVYDAYFSTENNGEMSPQLRRLIFGPYLSCMTETARWARAKGCHIIWGHFSFRRYMNDYGKRLLFTKIAKRSLSVHRGLK